MKVFSTNSLHLSGLLLLLVSITFYLLAPKVYSYTYCSVLFLIYLFSSAWVIKLSTINKNFLNFHVLFLISFFFVNFVYPVFLYPISVVYFPVYRLKFNQDIITKATALALVGSSAFNFGVLFQIRKKETYGKLLNFNAHTILLFLNAILIFLFMGLIAFGGSSFIQGHFKSTANIPPSLTILFQVTLSLAIICAFYLIKDQKNKISVAIIKINKLVIFIYLLFSLLYIFAGDRGPFIQVTIIFLVALTMFIKPIKLKSFIILALSGMLVLTFIGYARTQHSNDDSVVSFRKGIKYMNLNSFFDIAMDLIVTNRNLYTGYEYVDKYGINYGKGLSFQIFAPFPVLPSVYTELVFNSKPDDLTSGRILTNYSKANYGLGTNLIIDLYMGFGVFGVIFFMFLLGYVVTIFQRKAHFSNNFNYIIAYMIMVSFAIYMPRSYITDPFRPIVWALLIFSVIKGLRLRLIQMFAKDIEN